MKFPGRPFPSIAAFFLGASLLSASVITGISIPVNSMDAISHPLIDNKWSVAVPPYPLSTSTGSGIGYIVSPLIATNPSDFSMHDQQYIAAFVPDPNRAIVTYQFDLPTVVRSLLIIEHGNGVSMVEGFYGNSLASMTSMGVLGGNLGSGPYAEGASNSFDFGNTTNAGLYFQFVVRQTSISNGYAIYRANPRDVNGVAFLPASAPPEVPEPATGFLLGGALLAGAVYRALRNPPPTA